MSTVYDLVKDRRVYSIDADKTVLEAARFMMEHSIGALPVLRNGELVGIFSERDVMNRVVAAGRTPGTTKISEVMTSNPRGVDADESVEECLFLMKEFGFRHLPIVSGKELKGLVSLRDLLLKTSVETVGRVKCRCRFQFERWRRIRSPCCGGKANGNSTTAPAQRNPQHEFLRPFPTTNPLIFRAEQYPAADFSVCAVELREWERPRAQKIQKLRNFFLVGLDVLFAIFLAFRMLLDFALGLVFDFIGVALCFIGKVLRIERRLHQLEVLHELEGGRSGLNRQFAFATIADGEVNGEKRLYPLVQQLQLL